MKLGVNQLVAKTPLAQGCLWKGLGEFPINGNSDWGELSLAGKTFERQEQKAEERSLIFCVGKNISLSSLQHCFGAKGRLFTFYLTLLPVLKGYFLLCQGFMRPCPLEILQAALGNILFSNQYLSPLSCVHRHCLGHHPFLMAFSLLWYWYCRCYRFEGKVKPLFSWSHNCLYCPHYCPRYCRAPLWQADHVKVAELESNCANIFFSSSPFPSL